jgi:hypothetical protein
MTVGGKGWAGRTGRAGKTAKVTKAGRKIGRETRCTASERPAASCWRRRRIWGSRSWGRVPDGEARVQIDCPWAPSIQPPTVPTWAPGSRTLSCLLRPEVARRAGDGFLFCSVSFFFLFPCWRGRKRREDRIPRDTLNDEPASRWPTKGRGWGSRREERESRWAVC